MEFKEQSKCFGNLALLNSDKSMLYGVYGLLRKQASIVMDEKSICWRCVVPMMHNVHLATSQ